MNELFSLSDHIAVTLDDVMVSVRCGLHPWERHPEHPNRLCISVKLYAHLHVSRTARMPIIDYDPIRGHIRALEDKEHIDLLETIADSITEVCFADPRVEACFIGIRKQDIFNEAGGAGINVFRTRTQWSKGA